MQRHRCCTANVALLSCKVHIAPVQIQDSQAESKFALNGLLAGIDQSYLQGNIVQITGEVGKDFPAELSAVLQAAHPSQLVITPGALSAKQRKAGVTTSIVLPPWLAPGAILDGTFRPRNDERRSTVVEGVYVLSSQSSYHACQQGHNVQTTDVFSCYFRYPSIGQNTF